MEARQPHPIEHSRRHRASAPSRCSRWLLPAALALLVQGCAEWSSSPVRTAADYGQSVRAMVTHQIYDPATAARPEPDAPYGIEGQKAEAVLQQTYRRDLGDPSRVRQQPQIMGRSAGSTGSGVGR